MHCNTHFQNQKNSTPHTRRECTFQLHVITHIFIQMACARWGQPQECARTPSPHTVVGRRQWTDSCRMTVYSHACAYDTGCASSCHIWLSVLSYIFFTRLNQPAPVTVSNVVCRYCLSRDSRFSLLADKSISNSNILIKFFHYSVNLEHFNELLITSMIKMENKL